MTQFQSEVAFFDFLEEQKQQIDCLILQSSPQSTQLIARLLEQQALLPAVLVHLDPEPNCPPTTPLSGEASGADSPFYHAAMVQTTATQLPQICALIDQAIVQFLKLSSSEYLSIRGLAAVLMAQQRRLAEKLKERLGYLGVYYKRNPSNFLRHLAPEEKQAFLEEMRIDYHDIILSYFAEESSVLNQKIDSFVNTIFLADVPVSQIVEIHMELMDEFSKQLRLEGRSEEVLLDYRLTLIDIIAHLCEMYRRSIPRES